MYVLHTLSGNTIRLITRCRGVWADYAHALVLAKEYERAKPICDIVLKVINEKSQVVDTVTVVLVHLHLSLLLKELAIEPDNQQELVLFRTSLF